ncbi:MAG: bifunctional enoyl-CoA hydratase/phosphate acetyltransferase [Magnetospirillum sp.]|nr:bifunctional enoyl-CoA hydratase/phosphate acetyltransferase [Magnetospirillum sp.]
MVEMLENRTWDEIAVGDTASLVRTCRSEDVELFGVATGGLNPTHFCAVEAAHLAHHGKVLAHTLWGGSLLSALFGNELPGPGSVLKSTDFDFLRPVEVGDTLTVSIAVAEKTPPTDVLFDCKATNQRGEAVFNGRARVAAPTIKVVQPKVLLQEVSLHRRHNVFEDLIARCQAADPISVAVCHPCDQVSLEGAVEAARHNLITPILVGPEAKIRAVALEFGIAIDGMRIVDTAHSHESAERSVALCRSGEAEALMKGSLHTDELMHEVANRDHGLRTSRRISHVFVMDVPTYPKMLQITDAAINIYPTLEDKVDILQNAIELAHVLGVELPKVALLSAVETVYPKINSTIEAAALCKMADRGQITGALLDGPLAFDNAISVEAAKIKKINSAVAGHADILLVPDLEAGNMLAKQLSYLADADAAGIVLGARVPIVLTSRADSAKGRLASCAVAVLFALARRARPQQGAAE